MTSALPAAKEKPKQKLPEIDETLSPELVIALCAPMGTPVHKVAEMLQKVLEDTFGYDCMQIRLSRYIEEHIDKSKLTDEYCRTKLMIDKGDELREEFQTPSFLCDKAIEEINKYRLREATAEQSTVKGERVAFIIDSIKNQAELDLLKFIYRDECYCIGVFSPKSQRVNSLKKRGMTEQQAYELIELDAGEKVPPEKRKFSQTVKKTFSQSDLFIRMGNRSNQELEAKLLRFLHLIFSTKVITPTPGEAAMYLAASAAANSGCLSRQVGACITDINGDVVSVGWNDVPKAGGGLYRCTSKEDLRCAWVENGKCQNSAEKDVIIEEICRDLLKNDIVTKVQLDKIRTLLSESKISALIEFSRAIHAEMYALIQAGSKGSSIAGGSLYCTTYPCHSCARHLVAAGIKNVYYIEPYSKSLAIHLHDDALTEDEDDESKVRLLAFDGVAPNRYLEFFSQQSRKDKGDVYPRNSRPKAQISLEAIPVLEGLVVKNLLNNLEKKNEGQQIVIPFGKTTGPSAA